MSSFRDRNGYNHYMKQVYTSIVILFFVLPPASCLFGQEPVERTLVFPDGDAKKGRLLFEKKMCSRCHTVEGVQFSDRDFSVIDDIHLGGINNRGWSRDNYASEIMDPQHRISPDHRKTMLRLGDRNTAETSPMLDYSQSLTVGDLVDLVMFLEGISEREMEKQRKQE